MELTINRPTPFLKRLALADWLFALALTIGAGIAFYLYDPWMDIYEEAILIATVPALTWLGWFWKPIRLFTAVSFGAALLAIYFYHGDLARMEQAFFLKYLISSQAAIMWMSALIVFATVAYWIGLLAKSEFAAKTGTALTWSAAAMAANRPVGALVRKLPHRPGRGAYPHFQPVRSVRAVYADDRADVFVLRKPLPAARHGRVCHAGAVGGGRLYPLVHL